jgi:glycosyltransferase involved in cell wall biosynthesis
VIRHEIVASTRRTIYVRFGDWPVWLSFGLVLFALVTPRRRPRAAHAPPPLVESPRTLVLVPTYDERSTIGEVLERLLELPDRVEILVIDDGSPDCTAEIVRDVAEREPRVRLIQRASKSGLASAYLAGFDRALAEGADLVVEMDADLSHRPEELPRLLAGARDHDVTIGSRYVPGGSVSDWSRARIALSRGGNGYARWSLGLPLHDATSGFRVYRRRLLEHLVTDAIRSDGYGFQIELAFRAWRDGFAVVEAPITFREREHGTSKISRRIVFEALWLVTVWGVRERFRSDGRRPAARDERP